MEAEHVSEPHPAEPADVRCGLPRPHADPVWVLHGVVDFRHLIGVNAFSLPFLGGRAAKRGSPLSDPGGA